MIYGDISMCSLNDFIVAWTVYTYSIKLQHDRFGTAVPLIKLTEKEYLLFIIFTYFLLVLIICV